MAYLQSIRLFAIRYWDLLQSPLWILHGLPCCVSQQNHLLKAKCHPHQLIHLLWFLKEVIVLRVVIVATFSGQESLVLNVIIVISLAILLIGVMLYMDIPLLGPPTLPRLLHLHRLLLQLILPPHLLSLTTLSSGMRSARPLVPLLLLRTRVILLLVFLTPHPMTHGSLIQAPLITLLVINLFFLHFLPLVYYPLSH